MEFTGVTFAGCGAEPRHRRQGRPRRARTQAPYMNTRSISKGGGISTFRSSVVVGKERRAARNRRCPASRSCWIRDSRSDTVPAMDIRTHGRGGRPRGANRQHQRRRGVLSDEPRHERGGRARADCQRLCGQRLASELPVEYAVEMNNLIRLEMKGSIG